MHLFYLFAGFATALLALLMLRLRSLPETEEEGRQFNRVKQYLAFVFMLASLSMFAAQFEARIPEDRFEKLNAVMLMFYFLSGQGLIYSLLILYSSPYAGAKYLKRALLPTLPLFALYIAIYCFQGDVRIYSAEEFFFLLPSEFLLVLRCILLAATIGSICYGIFLCHKAKREYDRLITDYFSETGFARSMWVYKLLWSAEALAIWVLLTYFYTNTFIEIVVGTLIIAVFSLYFVEFRKYAQRYLSLRPALTFARDDSPAEVHAARDSNPLAMRATGQRIEAWVQSPEKFFTRPRLTIGDVSRETGIPKRKISQYINGREENFCSWINKLRIGEAVRLLDESSRIPITEIAEIVGFCDLPAFSRAFKKAKGCSPRTYRDGR